VPFSPSLTDARPATLPGAAEQARSRPRVPLRRTAVALLLAGSLTVGAVGCSAKDSSTSSGPSKAVEVSKAAEAPSPSTSAEKQKFAKTRFVANAGLAAGATYQWIVKPYKAGKFKKGADKRTFTLIKAGLAGAFTYNRLKAAVKNAKGDPTLSKAVAPLSSGIDKLKDLGKKLRKGDAGAADVGSFDKIIKEVKGAGKSAGAEVKDKVPSTSELKG
jgi:hypothetical protein